MQNIGFPFEFEDSYGHGKRLKFIIKAIENYCQEYEKEKEQIKILDIGCGTGIGLTFPIASLGYKIVGVDTDKYSIDWANKENIYPNVSFECGFLENLTYLSDFDIIICSEVLEHIPNPKNFLLLLKSRLNSKGIIILTIPNGYGWFEFEKFIYEKLRPLIKPYIKLKIIIVPKKPLPLATLNKKDIHLQRFSYRGIKKLIKEIDFSILQEGKAGLFGGLFQKLFYFGLNFGKN